MYPVYIYHTQYFTALIYLHHVYFIYFYLLSFIYLSQWPGESGSCQFHHILCLHWIQMTAIKTRHISNANLSRIYNCQKSLIVNRNQIILSVQILTLWSLRTEKYLTVFKNGIFLLPAISSEFHKETWEILPIWRWHSCLEHSGVLGWVEGLDQNGI